MKITPGPWKAHQTNQARSGVPEFEIHWSDIGECVAEIVHGEADARLIAAAPDMVAALADVLDTLQNAPPVELTKRLAETYTKCLAAYTKAHGGAA